MQTEIQTYCEKLPEMTGDLMKNFSYILNCYSNLFLQSFFFEFFSLNFCTETQIFQTSKTAHALRGLHQGPANTDRHRADAREPAHIPTRQRKTVQSSATGRNCRSGWCEEFSSGFCRNANLLFAGRRWNGLPRRDELYSSGHGRP